MATVPADIEGPSDAELIDAVRKGTVSAYGSLYERHVASAYNLARQLSRSPAEADDLVSEAFAKVLDTLRGGRGPDSAFRAYLLTALRHTAYDKTRRDRKIELSDDVETAGGAKRRRAVLRHRGRRPRALAGRTGVRPAPRALAGRPLAHRDRGPVTRRGRADPRPHRQRRLRARLPRPRGPAAGLPAGPPRRDHRVPLPGHRRAARRLDPQRAGQAGEGPGRGPPRRVHTVPRAGRRARRRQRRHARVRRTTGAGRRARSATSPPRPRRTAACSPRSAPRPPPEPRAGPRGPPARPRPRPASSSAWPRPAWRWPPRSWSA